MLLKLTTTAFMALFMLAAPHTTWSQDDSEKAIEATFEKLAELGDERDWENMNQHMTKKAGEEIQVSLIMMASSMGSEELDQMSAMIPGFDDVRDDVAEILENHGLDELELPSMMRMQMGDEMNDEDPTEGKADELNKKVLEALANVENRWKCLSELDEALADSPLGMGAGSGIFSGALSDIEVHEDRAHAKIKLTPPAGMGGMQMQMPAMLVKFEKEDGEWKFAGLDIHGDHDHGDHDHDHGN